MAETTAQQVADYMIWFSHEHGDPISNLKLQKLLYYAQAWFLALEDHPLFDDPLEAWVHGPVVAKVYGAYKRCTWQAIPNEIAEMPVLPRRVDGHIQEVLSVYGDLTAYHLERLTHSEFPWQNARKGLPPDAMSRNVILHDDMKSFYRSAASAQ